MRPCNSLGVTIMSVPCHSGVFAPPTFKLITQAAGVASISWSDYHSSSNSANPLFEPASNRASGKAQPSIRTHTPLGQLIEMEKNAMY